NIYHEMYESGYDIGIYTDSLFISPEEVNIISNIKSGKEAKDLEGINRPSGLMKLFYKMVAFKYLPHYAKPYFLTYTGDLDLYKRNDVYTPNNDFLYYDMLKKQGIKTQEKNIFKFTHLLGVHPPYLMNSNIEKVNESTALEQSTGVIKIIKTLFDDLKKQNIYDNSTIIVMADHGDYSEKGQNPLFMIKDHGSNKEFNTSSLPLSYDDLQILIKKALQNESVNTYIKDNISPDRILHFCYYDWFTEGSWDKDNLPPISDYTLSGNIKNFALTTILDRKEYDGNGNLISTPYTLGNPVVFDSTNGKNNFNHYALYGFSQNEGTSTWSLGGESCLSFIFDTLPEEDMKLQVKFYDILGNDQELIVYAGDMLISDESNNELTRTYKIPISALEQNKLRLKFIYPNAISPKELGINDDTRILAFKFESLTIN
ncbi:MAG: hypothetical protein LUG90_04065, partial [Clostridiaceae bacterium]|nr:hypothetical protein [Clostridiaceae bacterium]